MTLRNGSHLSQAVLFMLVGTGLCAQESGTLNGTVKDPSGQKVSGAQVILESPALFSPRVLVTDKSGEWRAPLLPVGTYRVVVSKDGFESARRGMLRVGINSSTRVDLVIAKVAVETVEVVATANIVDKTQVNTATNYSSDTLAELPLVNRSFAGALDMTPGTSSSTDGTNYVIRGGSTTNTNYRVNGAEVKNDYRNSLGSNWVIEDNIEDAQVTTSNVNVRYGRALAGAVNILTKGGSNEFAGSARVKLWKDGWYARTKDSASWAQRDDFLNKTVDITVRGPVIKDRLWFSLGTIQKPNQTSIGNLAGFAGNTNAPLLTGEAALDTRLLAGPGNGYALAKFDALAPYVEKFDSKYLEGKLAGAINADHRVELSFVTKKDVSSNQPGHSGGISIKGLGENWDEYKMSSFTYTGILGSGAFLEGRFTQTKSTHKLNLGHTGYPGEGVYVSFGDKDAPSDGATGTYLPFGYPYGSTPESEGNINASLNLKLMPSFHGSHDLDVGMEYFDSFTDNGEGWGARNLMFFVGGAYSNASGNMLFPAMNFPGFWNYNQNFDSGSNWSTGPAPFVRQALGPKGRAHAKQLGFYVNDAWTIDQHWMVGAGLRIDQNKALDVDGRSLASSNVPTFAGMVRWDVKGDSAHLLTLTLASNGGNYNQALFGQFTGKATTVEIQRGWSANPMDAGSGAAADQIIKFVPYADLVNLSNYGRVTNFIDASKRYKLAGDLRAPRVEDLSLGYKRSFADQSRVGITLVYRRWKDMWAARYDWADEYVFTVKDPSNSGLADKRDIHWRYDNDSSLNREYRAVELEFSKPFGARTSLQGNYTYSHLTGNWNDGDINWGGWRNNDPTMGTPTWNAAVLQRMGLSRSDYAAEGLLSNNQTHKARVALTHLLPVGKDGKITLSLMLSYDSGRVWSAGNSAKIDPNAWPMDLTGKYGDSLGVYADETYRQYYSKLGAYSNNDTYSTDFKVTWDFPLPFAKVHFIGDCKVGNVFNTSMPYSSYLSFSNDWSNGRKQLILRNPSIAGTQPPYDTWQISYHTGGRWASFSAGLRF